MNRVFMSSQIHVLKSKTHEVMMLAEILGGIRSLDKTLVGGIEASLEGSIPSSSGECSEKYVVCDLEQGFHQTAHMPVP